MTCTEAEILIHARLDGEVGELDCFSSRADFRHVRVDRHLALAHLDTDPVDATEIIP